MHIKQEKQSALQLLIGLCDKVQKRGKWKRFMQVLQKGKLRNYATGVVSLGALMDAFTKSAGITLSISEILAIRNAYVCKSERHQVYDDFDPNVHDPHDVELQIMDTIARAERTQDMLDAYREIDFKEHDERVDSVLIDYHGTGSGGGKPTAVVDKAKEKTFTHIYQLAQVVGDGTLPRVVVETSGQGSRLQHLKDRHLGLASNYDFFRHIVVLLKDLDPSSNGYVTNQELEDCFKAIYPEQLGHVHLKKLFAKYASIQNKLLIDYRRIIQAI